MVLQNKKAKRIKLYLHFVKKNLKHTLHTKKKLLSYGYVQSYLIYLFNFENVPIYVSVFI